MLELHTRAIRRTHQDVLVGQDTEHVRWLYESRDLSRILKPALYLDDQGPRLEVRQHHRACTLHLLPNRLKDSVVHVVQLLLESRVLRERQLMLHELTEHGFLRVGKRAATLQHGREVERDAHEFVESWGCPRAFQQALAVATGNAPRNGALLGIEQRCDGEHIAE